MHLIVIVNVEEEIWFFIMEIKLACHWMPLELCRDLLLLLLGQNARGRVKLVIPGLIVKKVRTLTVVVHHQGARIFHLIQIKKNL